MLCCFVHVAELCRVSPVRIRAPAGRPRVRLEAPNELCCLCRIIMLHVLLLRMDPEHACR